MFWLLKPSLFLISFELFVNDEFLEGPLDFWALIMDYYWLPFELLKRALKWSRELLTNSVLGTGESRLFFFRAYLFKVFFLIILSS